MSHSVKIEIIDRENEFLVVSPGIDGLLQIENQTNTVVKLDREDVKALIDYLGDWLAGGAK